MESRASDRLSASPQAGALRTNRLGSRKGVVRNVLTFCGRQEITACRIYIRKINSEEVRYMPTWEIWPAKPHYQVGDCIRVRPALLDGVWMKPGLRKSLPAKVIYVHPKERFLVAAYQVTATFFGHQVSTIRESFIIPKTFR